MRPEKLEIGDLVTWDRGRGYLVLEEIGSLFLGSRFTYRKGGRRARKRYVFLTSTGAVEISYRKAQAGRVIAKIVDAL